MLPDPKAGVETFVMEAGFLEPVVPPVAHILTGGILFLFLSCPQRGCCGSVNVGLAGVRSAQR